MHNKIFDEDFLGLDEYVVFNQYVEYLSQMSWMFFQRVRENDNVVDIDFDKFAIDSKQFVDLFLNINKRIFVIYYDDIEIFLISMTDDDEFMSIMKMNFSLIKECETVHDDNI